MKSYAGRTSFFERVFVAGEQALGFGFVFVERREVGGRVGLFEVVRRPLPLGALVQLAEGDVGVVLEVVHRIDVLQSTSRCARGRT